MINSVTLVGRLTRDIEVKKTTSGVSVTGYTIAVNEPKDQNGNQKTNYVDCVAWKNQADFLGRYARKGMRIGVSGRLSTRTYQRNDGTNAKVTEVIVNSVDLLESRPQDQAQNNAQMGQNQPQNNMQPQYNQYQQPQNNMQPTQGGYDPNAGLLISNDDLPF